MTFSPRDSWCNRRTCLRALVWCALLTPCHDLHRSRVVSHAIVSRLSFRLVSVTWMRGFDVRPDTTIDSRKQQWWWLHVSASCLQELYQPWDVPVTCLQKKNKSKNEMRNLKNESVVAGLRSHLCFLLVKVQIRKCKLINYSSISPRLK